MQASGFRRAASVPARIRETTTLEDSSECRRLMGGLHSRSQAEQREAAKAVRDFLESDAQEMAPQGVHGHALLPARSEAAGGEGVAEAAQVASEVMWRSRVGLCDDAARQGAVPSRCHTPRMLPCPPVHPRTGIQVHLTPSFSTEEPNGRGASGYGGVDGRGVGHA